MLLCVCEFDVLEDIARAFAVLAMDCIKIKPDIVDRTYVVRLNTSAPELFLPAATVGAVRSTYCNYSPWVRPCHLENGGS